LGGVVELNHVIVKHYVTVLRSKETSTPEFQHALEMLGSFLAKEMTCELALRESPVETPITSATGFQISEKVGIVPILRAGLALVRPFRELIPNACVLHLGMYRNEETAQPVAYYNKLAESPEVETAFLVDPMLATGGSAVAAINELRRAGVDQIVFGCVIAAPEGIAVVRQKFPEVKIVACSIDEGLNDINYIVPGLGDAGDRYFGTV
jgi:uracil phosphoribosyltransferase